MLRTSELAKYCCGFASTLKIQSKRRHRKITRELAKYCGLLVQRRNKSPQYVASSPAVLYVLYVVYVLYVFICISCYIICIILYVASSLVFHRLPLPLLQRLFQSSLVFNIGQAYSISYDTGALGDPGGATCLTLLVYYDITCVYIYIYIYIERENII